MTIVEPIINKKRKPLHELLPLDKPLRINIDPCDACNFQCDFCFHGKTNSFHGGVMSLETFEKVIEQIKEFDGLINVIQLFGLGEPLLNKNVPFFIRRLKEEKISEKVKITTNGSLLTPTLIDSLIDAGLDEFVLSLNGLKDLDFERIANVKVSFSTMFDNIKYIYANRKECYFHIKIIGEYFTENEKKYFIDEVGQYADSINIDGLINHWSGVKVTNLHRQQYAVNEDFLQEWSICALCFYELMIHSDGSVSPCAVDWQKDKQNLGNIYDSTLKKIWNSEFRRKIIMSFLKGEENPYMPCSVCEYPLSGASVNLDPYKEELLKKYV